MSPTALVTAFMHGPIHLAGLSLRRGCKGVFGRCENMEQGKQEEENMVKNEIFSYLIQERI